jgi:voltage-gated potassium channel
MGVLRALQGDNEETWNKVGHTKEQQNDKASQEQRAEEHRLIVFFVIDFCYRFFTAPSKSTYFLKNWGWADLLACIQFLRIFRIFRVVRASRLMREFGVKNMLNEVINNRAGIVLYITILSITILAEGAAVLVLKARHNPSANLTSAGDAVRWVFVTITTVGYGDYYPTTAWGRVLGVLTMFSGVALIGVLASYLSSFFLAPPKKKAAEEAAGPNDLKARLSKLEALLDEQSKANAALREEVGEIKQLVP